MCIRDRSIYFLTRHFGILPFVGYAERKNVTSRSIFDKSDIDFAQIKYLKSINYFDIKLYEYAIAKLDALNIKEGLPPDEKKYRLNLGKTSKEVPRVAGNYFFNFFNPFLADGISSKEMFSERPGFWIIGTGCLTFWIRLLNINSKFFIRFFMAENPPVSVVVDGINVDFKLNLIDDSESQGFIVFDLNGGSDVVREIAIQFAAGSIRNHADKRLLSAMITQISVYDCAKA